MEHHRQRPSSTVRVLLVIAGWISFVLGVIGIVLPLLPTTPFFLLSAACFIRSSQRAYLWLINHKIFGSYIHGYCRFRAVPIRSKIVAIVTLWVFILISAIFAVSLLWVRILLVCIAISVSIHILMLKTLTKEMMEILINERKQAVNNKGSH